MSTLTAQSAKDFATARQQIFIKNCLNFLLRRPNDLLAFEEVKQLLKLRDSVYRGLHEIELDTIIGSAGKHRDFTRTFRPKNYKAEDRWRRVDELFHKQGFEPIEVYKVGQVYFVRDGHHRVSVNRTHHIPTIEAYVVEYSTPVSITKEDNLASIRLKLADPNLPKFYEGMFTGILALVH